VGGWEFTLPGSQAVYTAGHLNFNSAKGDTCIAALQNFACPDDAGAVPASAYSAVIDACLGVLSGTIANGSGGCISAFECANGFCQLPSDGGTTGTCTALVGNGGTCVPPTNSNESPDQMCSQSGTYTPMLYCDRLAGGDAGACAAPLPNGSTCYNGTTNFWSDYGCTSLMCGDLGCGGTVDYSQLAPAWCSNYALDGGGGG
jgi:hypothetical protein